MGDIGKISSERQSCRLMGAALTALAAGLLPAPLIEACAESARGDHMQILPRPGTFTGIAASSGVFLEISRRVRHLV